MRIVHSDLRTLLAAYTEAGIILHAVYILDELTAQVHVDRKDMRQFSNISEKYTAKIEVLHRSGIHWTAKRLYQRPVLVFGIIMILCISAMIPGMVLTVEVTGNSQIADQEILETAAAAGVRFGARKSRIRSEKVKNQLMEMLPQLQWVGVTTDGCVATVSVKEQQAPAFKINHAQNRGIFAERDGVIHSIQVTKGNPLCTVGQVVRKGELLISAYTDCGLTLRATGSEGEIFARTMRKLKTVLPAVALNQTDKTDEVLRFSLLIGKKRINFCKDSGICDTSCDKMYKEYYMALPGGFELPFAIAVERLTYYNTGAVATADILLEELEQWSEDYLRRDMVAGQILSADISMEQNDLLSGIEGTYQCLEMIGRLQQEEITGNYGKTD